MLESLYVSSPTKIKIKVWVCEITLKERNCWCRLLTAPKVKLVMTEDRMHIKSLLLSFQVPLQIIYSIKLQLKRNICWFWSHILKATRWRKFSVLAKESIHTAHRLMFVTQYDKLILSLHFVSWPSATGTLKTYVSHCFCFRTGFSVKSLLTTFASQDTAICMNYAVFRG